jgi:hypothetical protein
VNLTGTCANSDTGAGITGSSTLFDTELRIGDVIVHGSNTGIVTAITSNTVCSISMANNGVETNQLGAGALADEEVDGNTTWKRLKRSAFAEPAANMLGELTVALTAPTTVTGTNTNFLRQLHVGDLITCIDDGTSTVNDVVLAIAVTLRITDDVPSSIQVIRSPTCNCRKKLVFVPVTVVGAVNATVSSPSILAAGSAKADLFNRFHVVFPSTSSSASAPAPS